VAGRGRTKEKVRTGLERVARHQRDPSGKQECGGLRNGEQTGDKTSGEHDDHYLRENWETADGFVLAREGANARCGQVVGILYKKALVRTGVGRIAVSTGVDGGETYRGWKMANACLTKGSQKDYKNREVKTWDNSTNYHKRGVRKGSSNSVGAENATNVSHP